MEKHHFFFGKREPRTRDHQTHQSSPKDYRKIFRGETCKLATNTSGGRTFLLCNTFASAACQSTSRGDAQCATMQRMQLVVWYKPLDDLSASNNLVCPLCAITWWVSLSNATNACKSCKSVCCTSIQWLAIRPHFEHTHETGNSIDDIHRLRHPLLTTPSYAFAFQQSLELCRLQHGDYILVPKLTVGGD